MDQSQTACPPHPQTPTDTDTDTHTILLKMSPKGSFMYWEMKEGDRGEEGGADEGKSVHQCLRLKGLILCVRVNVRERHRERYRDREAEIERDGDRKAEIETKTEAKIETERK